MRIPIPPMGRRPRPPPGRQVLLNRNARNCRWSSSAKCVLDPFDAVFAVGQPVERDHIEAHRADPPRRAPLQEEPGGANDFSLLTAIHGSRRAAEIAAGSLAHFDDDQDAVVEAHQIKFPAPTAQVALEHGETSRL